MPNQSLKISIEGWKLPFNLCAQQKWIDTIAPIHSLKRCPWYLYSEPKPIIRKHLGRLEPLGPNFEFDDWKSWNNVDTYYVARDDWFCTWLDVTSRWWITSRIALEKWNQSPQGVAARLSTLQSFLLYQYLVFSNKRFACIQWHKCIGQLELHIFTY